MKNNAPFCLQGVQLAGINIHLGPLDCNKDFFSVKMEVNIKGEYL